MKIQQSNPQAAARYSSKRILFIGLTVLICPIVVFASPLSIPHEFSPGDQIRASEINDNFESIATSINDNDTRLSELELQVLDFGGIPAGAVVFFNLEECPEGWTEMSGLRGRVPLGLPPGGQLGSTVGEDLEDEGLRTISEVPAHAHAIDPPSTGTSMDGNHVHSADPPSTGTSADGSHIHSADPPSTNTSTNGNHDHTVHNGNGGVASTHLQAANAIGDGAVADSSSPIGVNGNHQHAVDIAAFNTGSSGSHSHTVNIAAFNVGSGGSHAHSVNIASFNSFVAGSAAVDVTMPYIQLLPCSKV